MRSRENFAPFLTIGLILTLAILAVFQLYFLREPGRIQAAETADQSAAVAAGRDLFQSNCTPCHGNNGQGAVGPALNSKELLKSTTDETFFGLIRTGVPGTVMPAWGQAYGGPFTDEQVTQLVAFLRAWEPNAPEITPVAKTPRAARGAVIFASTCFICHGQNGQGTDRAPALNDPQRLKQFDDAWYRATIAQGRPAKGMPTWGTVLSPEQIDDVVALLAAWRDGKTVTPPIPFGDHLASALFALQRSDPLDAVFHLNAALEQASDSQAADVQAVLDLIKQNDLAGAQARLNELVGANATLVEQGQQLFAANCAPCHGPDGKGNIGPNLHSNAFVQSQTNDQLRAFILAGRPGTAMAGFQGRLSDDQLAQIVALLDTWRTSPAPTPASATEAPSGETARPSNPGGPGPAATMTGDATAGAQIFASNCQACHGDQGTGGVANPGSTDGSVPPLNPIDETLVNKDPKVFAYNLDLFIEHGSTPEGDNPQISMPAWGDQGKLTPQQIADVIAYVMSLNPPK
jgi:mono/diheme cytochrome c family protein